MARGFSQETFRSIAFHRATHLATCRDANPAKSQIIGTNDQYQQRMRPRLPFVINPFDIATASESDAPLYHSVSPAYPGQINRSPRSGVGWLASLPVPLLRLGLANTQLLAPLLSAPLEDLASGLTRSPCKETMGALSFSFLRLIRSLRHALLLHQLKQRQRPPAGRWTSWR